MENQNIETSLDNSEIRKSKKNNFFNFDYRQIEIEVGFNCREDMGDLEALGNDIAENGQSQPVSGFRKNGCETFILTDGHRRLAAICLVNALAVAQGKEVPVPYVACMIDSSKNNPEERVFSMLRSGEDPHKKALNRVEIATAMKRLVNQNKLTAKDIANKIGGLKRLAYVYDTLMLGDSPRYLQSLVVNGTLPPTKAIDLIKSCKQDHAEILARLAEFDKAVAEELDNETSNEVPVQSNEPSSIPSDVSMLDSEAGEEGDVEGNKEVSKETPAVQKMVALPAKSKEKKQLSKEAQKAADAKAKTKAAMNKALGKDKTYPSLVNDAILAAQDKGFLSEKSKLWEILKLVSISPKAVSAIEFNHAVLCLAKAEMLAEEAIAAAKK